MSDHTAHGTTFSDMLTSALTRFARRPAFEADGSTLTYARLRRSGRPDAGRPRGPGRRAGDGCGRVLSPDRPEAWLTLRARYWTGEDRAVH